MSRIVCVALLALLVGCWPKLTPVLAERQLTGVAPMDRASVAVVGQSMLHGLDIFSFAVFSPREAVVVTPPDHFFVHGLTSDQRWVVCCRADEKSVIVEAPKEFAAGARLGLRIDPDGRVVGNRPWFDLTAKARPLQPDWTGRRLLFARNGSWPVDVFSFDLRYLGMEGGLGVFELSDYKAAGARSASPVRLVSGPAVVRMHGLDVRLVGLYPDHVRYVVEPTR
jgi:hypothetical protein